MTVRILVGDARARLRELPAESVHCVVTSPPYWGLRDYGVEGAIGLEPTFDQHLDVLVHVFREVRRVLRKDGTCWLNYGDAYAGSWGAQGRGDEYAGNLEGGSILAARQIRVHPKVLSMAGSTKRTPGLKPKDLMLLPARIALALQADGWWLRSEIVWHKPNAMPESVRDRPTSAHEKVYLLVKSARYFYDAEAVRIPITGGAHARRRDGERKPAKGSDPNDRRAGTWKEKSDKQRGHGRRHAGFNDRWDGMTKAEQQSGGANLRNVWTIPTYGFPDAHFATFPPALVEPAIKAGTSEQGVCRSCGAPLVRELAVSGAPGESWHDHEDDEVRGNRGAPLPDGYRRETTGWLPSCDCGGAYASIPAVVLDPFGGAGTVGLVADRLGRDAVLIELNPEYAAMARARIEADAPLLTIVA